MNHNFILESLSLLTHHDIDKKTRTFIGVLVKSLIKDYWESFSSNIMRDYIFKLISITLNEREISEIIGLILVEVINRDGMEIWIDPF